MRFARLGSPGQEVPVILHEGRHLDVRAFTADLDGDFWQRDLSAVELAAARGELPVVAADRVRFGAPVARPHAVVCVGQNYAAHARESGAEPPEHVVVFHKHPNTVVGPDDDVPVEAWSHKLDWEVELALVIGRPTFDVRTREEALASIAGVTVADDISEREWQLETSGGQWGKGKSPRRSTPLGPYLVTLDEVDLGRLRLRSFVNGEARQDSTTADMIFDPARIVMDLSHVMQLDAGDVICTGTPQGVALSGRFGYLQAGDVVRTEIDGLGSQEHRIVAGEDLDAGEQHAGSSRTSERGK